MKYFNIALDRFLCFIGCHRWTDGPGEPCASCGKEDDFYK